MSLIGVHIDNILDIVNILAKNKLYENIDLVQTFVNATTDYTDKKYDKVKKHILERNIKISIHASYSINLSKQWNENDWWIQQFINEINAAHTLNAFCIVIHTGKKLQLSEPVSINNMYSSLLFIHEKTKHNNSVKILIETPSGQGTELLTQLEDLCNFLKKFYNHPDSNIKNRFGMCFDTCHVFAAGYDIRLINKQTSSIKIMDIIHNSIGIDKIKLCHINDSKKDLGSKRDRHENIGIGMIGIKPIMHIVKFMKILEIPMILETPNIRLDYDYQLLIN